MVDPNRMAISYGIEDLEEGILDQSVVANIKTLLSDTREKVTLRAVLQNYVCAVLGVHDPNKGHNVGMVAGFVVKLYLPLLKSSLPRVESKLVQGLDRVLLSGENILSGVYDAVSTHSKNASQFKSSSEAEAQAVLWCALS